MSQHGPYAEPLSVEVFDGEVVVRSTNGPLGISLTPGAAAETAARLAEAAAQASQDQAQAQDGDA